MSQFEVHHVVRSLLENLGSSESPENLIEKIEKCSNSGVLNTHKVASQNDVLQLAEKSRNREKFIQKYEELKAKNVDCLGSYVHLLSRISSDTRLCSFLEKNAKKFVLEPTVGDNLSLYRRSVSESKASEVLTPDEVPELRDRLRRAASQVHAKKPAHFDKPVDKQHKTKQHPYHFPTIPDWCTLRPNVTLDFITARGTGRSPLDVGLANVPLSSQENLLLSDILYCLEGVDGRYITANPLQGLYGQRTFSISPSIDPSLSELAQRILPLASHYSTVVRFIEEKSKFEWGQVNHALTAAMETILLDYMVLIAQLESFLQKGNFTLSKMLFYIQPSLRTMEILANTATTINKAGAKGGKVLSLLHEQMTDYIADSKGQELCLYLTQAASIPYIDILEKWIYKGVICDPFEEFLVEDNEVIQKDDYSADLDYSSDYWEKRYMKRRERIPVFLERIADIILRTGKYLNVIRQCGKNIKAPQSKEIIYNMNEVQYFEAIEEAYHFASKTLLNLVIEENDLMGRLKSVKHFFLLDQGDFILQFMDSCETELSKNIDDIVPTRLESLLEMALRTSSANSDPYKDDMRTELLPYDLIFQLSKILSIETQEEKEYKLPQDKLNLIGMESFSFGYEVKWPVSLILNRRAIACYQMIFRHLFHCKHVERLLCRVWICNKAVKKIQLKDAKNYVPAFALRQQMLNCIQNLEYYMMVEVIEPNWHVFLSKMNNVSNVDEVLNFHHDFLDSCMKDCMLTNPVLLRIANSLMATCEQFCLFMQQTTKYSLDAELTSMLGPDYESLDTYSECSESPTAGATSIHQASSFQENIKQYDNQFTNILVKLLDNISSLGRDNHNEKLVNVLYRMNFNEFYSQELEKATTEKSAAANEFGHEETSG